MSSMNMADRETSPSVAERGTLKQLGMRACGTCVKAKVKCVPNTQNRKCQRCERLDKQCQPAISSSRKRTQPGHVAQLEKKLDNIVTLLTRPKGQGENIEHPQLSLSSPLPHTSPAPSHQTRQASKFAESITSLQLELDSPHHDTGTSSTPSSSQDPRTPQISRSHFDVPKHEEAFLLLEFRTQMAPQYPFVVIPPEATSESLRKERPMLWKAILTAASCHNASRQEAMGWEFIEEFSKRLLLKAEKSLDLLQAILIHLAWYHYHSVANPQVMNLLSLAKSLVTNLGYHRTRSVKDRRKDLIEGPDGLPSTKQIRETSFLDSKTLEEWRALAGCFFFSVLTTSSCKRTEPLPFTPHLKESCERLAVFREYESDKLLVQLVAIQHISLKISSIFNETDDYSGSSAVPLRMFIKSIQSELDNFKRNLPFDIRHDSAILCHYQAAEISLYEIGLYHAFNVQDEKAHRLNVLYSCLLAVKTFFNTHFSLSYPVSSARCYTTWAQCRYAIRMGIKLLRIPDAEGWDSDHAREVLDFPGMTEKVIAKLKVITRLRKRNGEQSMSHDVSNAEHDIFSQYLKQMQCLKNWSESLQSSNSTLRGTCSTSYSQQPAEDEGHDLDPADIPSETGFAQSFPDNFLMTTESDNYLWEALHGQNDDWMAFGT